MEQSFLDKRRQYFVAGRRIFNPEPGPTSKPNWPRKTLGFTWELFPSMARIIVMRKKYTPSSAKVQVISYQNNTLLKRTLRERSEKTNRTLRPRQACSSQYLYLSTQSCFAFWCKRSEMLPIMKVLAKCRLLSVVTKDENLRCSEPMNNVWFEVNSTRLQVVTKVSTLTRCFQCSSFPFSAARSSQHTTLSNPEHRPEPRASQKSTSCHTGCLVGW